MRLSDVDLIEIEEDYAAAPIIAARYLAAECGVPEADILERTNVNGGAVVMGHPIATGGTRIALTLAREMKRRNSRLGHCRRRRRHGPGHGHPPAPSGVTPTCRNQSCFPYSDALVNAVVGDYGWPEHYFEDRFFWDPERIKRTQDVRLRNEIARAATVPFYKRLWERAGVDPRSIRGVQDLHRLPMYTVEDLRESIALAPPYGDHQGVLPGPNATGLRIYFSAGTTGRPRPTVYTTWDRLAGGCISARSMYLHGCRPGQTVLNAWAYGPAQPGLVD